MAWYGPQFILLSHFVSPKAGRVVDNCMSPSNLSSSSNFLTWASASHWALVTAELPTIEACPLHSRSFSLLQHAMCSLPNRCIKPADILRTFPHSHGSLCTSKMWAPCPTQSSLSAQDSPPPLIPLFQGPFLPCLCWLANYWFLPYTEGQERQEKRQATPDWEVAVLINKGTYLWILYWAAKR